MRPLQVGHSHPDEDDCPNQLRLLLRQEPATLTVCGCPAATDGLDGELARLQDRGTGGMALLQRRAPALDLQRYVGVRRLPPNCKTASGFGN